MALIISPSYTNASEVVKSPSMTTNAPGVPDAADAGAIRVPRFYFGYYIVGAAFIAQFVAVGAQNYVVGVFLKPMTDDLSWTRAEFTAARSIGQVAMIFVAFFIGSHVDRHGGRRLMIIGGVILGASLFALSFVQELWQWLVLNGLVLTAGSAMVGNLVVHITLSKGFVQ